MGITTGIIAGVSAATGVAGAVQSNQQRQEAKGAANKSNRDAARARQEANKRRRDEESTDALLRQRNAAKSRQRARLGASIASGENTTSLTGQKPGAQGTGKTLVGL